VSKAERLDSLLLKTRRHAGHLDDLLVTGVTSSHTHTHRGQLSLASLRGRLIEYQLQLG